MFLHYYLAFSQKFGTIKTDRENRQLYLKIKMEKGVKKMPTINQSGLETLMSTANNSAQKISDTISTGSANMCNAIGQVWGCPQAQNFASEFQTKMNSIVQNFRENMNAFQTNVNSNTQNYNEINQSSLSVPAVNYSDASVNTNGITSQLPDGQIGLLEGASDSVVNAFKTAIDDIVSSVNTANSSISTSGAFDDDESAAAAGMYSKLGNILAQSSTELEESLRAYIQSTIEQYGERKRINVDRSNNA